MTRRRKIVVIVASAIAALLAIQTLTYVLFARRAERALPWAGIRSLGDFALLEEVDFVVIEPETWSALTEAQKADFLAELACHVGTIYFSSAHVPDEGVHSVPVSDKDKADYERWKRQDYVNPSILEKRRREIEAGRRIVGFKGGLRLSWKMGRRDLFCRTSSSSIWMSNKGAEGRGDVHVWILFCWVRIWTLYTMQA